MIKTQSNRTLLIFYGLFIPPYRPNERNEKHAHYYLVSIAPIDVDWLVDEYGNPTLCRNYLRFCGPLCSSFQSRPRQADRSKLRKEGTKRQRLRVRPMLIPKPSANNEAVEPPIPCTCTAHENPSLQSPSPESSRQQTHGYAKVFMWMEIVRDVRHYSRVSRISANQVVPQGGMQQSLLILGETGPTLKGRIYTKRTPCTRMLLLLLLLKGILILTAYFVTLKSSTNRISQPHHSSPMAMRKARKAKVS